MISGKAKVCGLMGCPVEHSMSPLLHNFIAGRIGIDFAYVPFLVDGEDVETAVNGARALNITGLNVTVPHKQQVIPFLTELDPGARAIGAVNTLVQAPGGYKGYNTDALGLLRAMEKADMEIEGKDWLLLGAGGAAKAAAYVLGSQGAGRVMILNRSRQRALELARDMNEKFDREFMTAMAMEDYGKLQDGQWQAIQTTSVGMDPHGGRAVIEDKGFYKRIFRAMDVIYTPSRTRFMELVEEGGGQTVNGLDMLLYQGAAAFELWNPDGKIPPDVITEARKLLENTLKGRDGGR